MSNQLGLEKKVPLYQDYMGEPIGIFKNGSVFYGRVQAVEKNKMILEVSSTLYSVLPDNTAFNRPVTGKMIHTHHPDEYIIIYKEEDFKQMLEEAQYLYCLKKNGLVTVQEYFAEARNKSKR